MSYACPVDLDLARLQREIQTVYARVAADPGGAFHFHRGPVYAVERLGYDAAELAALPDSVTSSFAGIGNPHAIARVPEGATVVDVGCGAGMDLLVSAGRVGAAGAAIGVDMTDDMLARARDGAREAGLSNVELRTGDATALPIADHTADVVMSNGVLNLVPDKARAAAEMFRVLKPGGRLQIADISVGEALSEDVRRDVDLWTG
ncbi:MAG: methyltransferase domain-containing protein [Vicinamibacterales bacterium]